MKIVILSNKKVYGKKLSIVNLVKLLNERLKNYNVSKDIDIEVIQNIDELKVECDIYILIVNNMDEFIVYSKRIKEANKVLILTKNSNVNFIMSCVNYTKNLLYLYVNIDTILKKIIAIYSENNKLEVRISKNYEK